MHYTILAVDFKEIATPGGKGWIAGVEAEGDSLLEAFQDAAKKLSLEGEVTRITGDDTSGFKASISETNILGLLLEVSRTSS